MYLKKKPPKDIEILAKNPNGVIYLTNWRESYDIFTVQEKSEDSSEWTWKYII